MRVTEKWREDISKGLTPDNVVKALDPKSVEVETGGADTRKAAFVISTGDEDRDGDIVNPSGWKLDSYRKNPIVLWAHDVKAPPVARCEVIAVKSGKLRAETVFPDKGVYPFADTVCGLVKGGFLSGTSVGFHPIEAKPRGKSKGVQFDLMELYEFSILPVPSNREALVEAKAAGHDIAPVVKWAEEFLDRAQETGLWIPRYQIEKALKAVLPITVTVPAMPSERQDVESEGHAIAGADLSDEFKGLVDIIEKGDLPGHEFRGNQYTNGGGSDSGDSGDERPALRSSTGAQAFDFAKGEARAAAMSDDALDYARTDARGAMESQRGMASSHMGKDEGYYTDEAATYAKEQSTRAFMRSVPTYTLSPSKNAEALKRQATLIEERVKPTRESPAGALAHWILRGRTASGADPFNMREPFENAARQMSKVLIRHLDDLNAKRKEAAVEIVKGDSEGHPFRGNQWTEGGGSGGDSPAHPGPTSAVPAYGAAVQAAEEAHAATPQGAAETQARNEATVARMRAERQAREQASAVPAGGQPTKYDRSALGHRITEQDRKESSRSGYNIYALPQMLEAADRVDEAVKNGLDPSRAFAEEFNPTRGNHSVARKLGLHLDVERGQWVVKPEAGPRPAGFRPSYHVIDAHKKGADSEYYEGPEIAKKEADMDVVKALADELFGDVEKAFPPKKDEAAPAAGDPQAPAAASAPAEGTAEGAPPAKGDAKNDEKQAGALPGGDPTEADPQLGGMLDQLAQGLLAEIQPLKQGGDPTQIATALKTALEKFAASFMQTYAGAPNPAAAAPGAPPAPAKPPAAPAPAPPQAAPAAPPQAAPSQAQPAPGAPPQAPGKGKPPWMKSGEVDIVKAFGDLDEDELRGIVQRATKKNIEDARRHLSGRLPD